MRITLSTPNGPYRDAQGRFRRKTREDMGDIERLTHDMVVRAMPKMIEDILRPNWPSDKKTVGDVRPTIRLRLPSDFAITQSVFIPWRHDK